MSRGIPEVERDVLVTYFKTHWKRSELALFTDAPEVPDPGHGHDEISPVTYFGQPFNASKPKDLDALSAFAVQDLRGFPLFSLFMIDGPFIGQTLDLTTLDGMTWILDTLGGDLAVVPQSDVEDGTTVAFTSTAGNFTADVTAGWLHGAGFVTLNIAEIGFGGQAARGFYDIGKRGTGEARIQLSVVIAAPPTNCPRLPDQYAGAAAALLGGVDFIRDASAAPGTLEREMADIGLTSIRQAGSMDPLTRRANHIGDDKGWRWYLFEAIFRRVYSITRAGHRAIAA